MEKALYPNERVRKVPTKKRQESKSGIYHVIAKGINKERIFNQQREKVYFKTIILKYLKKYAVEIYSYCIMSNHVHIIIRAEIQCLSLFMSAILREYAVYYNYKHHRNGHVFQNRFTSECIENDRYFWTCLRYIHLNPVKANMLKNPVRYKFSSLPEYMLEMPILIHDNAIIMYKKAYQDFEEFERFHMQRQTEIFIDVKDEITIQQQEIAMTIAERLFKERKLTLLCRVFEERKIREEYILALKQTLEISHSKAKELYVYTRNRVENKGQ